MNQPNIIIIIGCGDIGIRVARRWQKSTSKIIGVVRSEKSAEKLRQNNIQPIVADLDQPNKLPELSLKKSLVYYFAPPNRSGVQDDRMRSFLAGITPENIPAQIIYISTSGVYGDCGSNWITEEQPVNPATDRSKRRVDAEVTLQNWAQNTSYAINILRVPGIYGPGRLPIDRVRNGEPILRAEDAPISNRIHADDLAQAAENAAHFGKSGAIYNVSDGRPSTVTEYYNTLADMLGVPRPPVITREEARRTFSPTRMSFLQESRRLDNTKMLRELRVELQYPSIQEGIRDSL